MRGGGLTPGILTASALAAAGLVAGLAGCGDPPLCAGDVFVAFAQTHVTTDLDAFAPGVQTNVQVRTSLGLGDTVTLEILDAGGAVVGTASRAVGRDGVAEFEDVTVPASRATLRATGSGTCGDGQDEIMVDVPAGAGCTVELSPAPEINAHYAPLGVLSARSDPDPVAPGYQTTVRVLTRPGWATEIFEATPAERSLGVITADAGGVASVLVTALDGPVAFRATCRGAGTELASRALAVFVDTTPPSCELVAPAPGSTITPASDENHDLGDGVQLQVTGRAADPDVAGEPVTVTVALSGGAPIAVPDAVTGDDGTATTTLTLLPAQTSVAYDFALTMRDHAGNSCTALATYVEDP
jgi:hypothetical protein